MSKGSISKCPHYSIEQEYTREQKHTSMMAVRQNSEECTKILSKNKNCSYNLMLMY
jgi:hypothetical protein